MIQSLRQIRRRIRSVDNTRKITKAMEMVAASKLKKYQNLLGPIGSYLEKLQRIFEDLTMATSPCKHPFFETREPKEILVFLVASDSGLCGSYNYNLFQTLEDFIATRQESISFFSIGRQGASHLKRRRFTIVEEMGVPKPQETELALSKITDTAKRAFTERLVDQIFFVHTEFSSMAFHKPKVELFLPFANREAAVTTRTSAGDYILEPDAARILEKIAPHYLELKIEKAVIGACVSEQISRMLAMEQATDNAADMIEALTLQRNKARQAGITRELIEVMTGFKTQQVK